MYRYGLALLGVLLTGAAGAATLFVPTDHVTIQAAVDVAAPGDTLRIAAGSYEEQVVVTTDLVLLGEGSGLTLLQAPLDMPHSIGIRDDHAVICVESPATSVVVSGLTIDGLGRAPEAGSFVGLLYYRTSGVIDDVAVRNIHRTPVTDDLDGIGLKVSAAGDGSTPPIAMREVTVTRFQKAGIVITGNIEADLERIVVDTDGLYSDSVQIGIECSFANAVSIRDLTIRNVVYDGMPNPFYTAVALLGYYTGLLTVDGGEITSSQTGIYLVHNDADLANIDVVADPLAAPFNHGTVCVGALDSQAADADVALPVPVPTSEQLSPPGRPPVTWSVRLRDMLLDGGSSPSSRGLGMWSSDAEPLDITVERCTITRWEAGTFVFDASIGRVWARMSGCRILDNQGYGVFSGSRALVDARGCWWGSASGPFHPTKNPQGLGDTVSDQVLWDPWLRGNLAPLPWPQTISLADHDGVAYRDTIEVDYLGGGAAPIYGHSTEVHWDPAVASLVEVTRPATGPFAAAVFFQALPLDGGLLVDAALGGDQPGIASGPLFRLVFEAVGMPDYTPSPISLVLRHARDQHNQGIEDLETDDGRLVVDLQAPVLASLAIQNQSLPFTDLYAKNGDLLSVTASITDGDPAFDTEHMRGTGASLFGYAMPYGPPDLYLAPQALWAARPATLLPADGEAFFWFEASDPSRNYTAMVTTSIIADNTAPQPPTGLVATAGHNTVDLAWNDPTSTDVNFRQLQVRANPWSDYPFYDGNDPGYPATAADGMPWYLGSGFAHQQAFADDGSERDIFYVAAIAEDMAGNQSPVSGSNRARAINYVLGDVRGVSPASPGDGQVTIHDLTRLGDTFGLIRTDAGFDGECDIAPATAMPDGIPTPDEEVGFDDLMIMAGQFAPVPGAEPAPAEADRAPSLAWRALADGVWALELLEPCPRLKGVHLVGLAPAGLDARVEAGALIPLQPSPVFVHAGRSGYEAHLAVLGRGMGLVGTGELLRLIAPAGTILTTPLLDLRDVDNQPLSCNLPTAVPGADTPTVFRSALPHPNPFNPATTLAFDLPSPQQVRLIVYNVEGKRVASLVHDDLPAGRHQVTWQGRDTAGRLVAAGTYLYRLEAGPWSASGKLELVK